MWPAVCSPVASPVHNVLGTTNMPVEPHCPNCRSSLTAPTERVMPDAVVEYRCPNCNYQIPLLAPAHTHVETCPECAAAPVPVRTMPGVDGTGLLNYSYCGSCGLLLGRFWGMIGL